MLDHSANAGRHRLVDRKDDLYQTPPEATRALLRVEPLPDRIWEPAAGRGAIAYVLKQNGFSVCTSDLISYAGFTLDLPRLDFLLEQKKPFSTAAIVTNPPYKLATAFVRHALELCPKVVMLLRLAFLEGDRRSDILDGGRLRRVHVFRNRLPMMHREDWTGPRATSSIPFAWFVWEAELGPTIINRISWE